jgi:hypothetical protein
VFLTSVSQLRVTARNFGELMLLKPLSKTTITATQINGTAPHNSHATIEYI